MALHLKGLRPPKQESLYSETCQHFLSIYIPNFLTNCSWEHREIDLTDLKGLGLLE